MEDDRHAYLIMAHRASIQFEKLIKLLDNVNNDLFIHMDKKAGEFLKEHVKLLAPKSRLFFLDRRNLHWGNFDLVKCELDLLSLCIRTNKYSWVHLISGNDLPIKTQDYIYNFFKNNPETQFLQIGNAQNYLNRLKVYHLFVGHKNPSFLRKIAEFVYRLNSHFKIDRLQKSNIYPVKASQWFSITGECAEYVISKRKEIIRFTKFTECPDEMFLGTILYGSKYWNQIYKTNISYDGHMRYIDWNSGGKSPRVIDMSYQHILDSSQMLFARKFDETVDSEIIEYIYQKVGES